MYQDYSKALEQEIVQLENGAPPPHRPPAITPHPAERARKPAGTHRGYNQEITRLKEEHDLCMRMSGEPLPPPGRRRRG